MENLYKKSWGSSQKNMAKCPEKSLWKLLKAKALECCRISLSKFRGSLSKNLRELLEESSVEYMHLNSTPQGVLESNPEKVFGESFRIIPEPFP